MKETILVLDFGTTQLKGLLFDESFNVVNKYTYSWQYSYPRHQWIEYSPMAYWEAALNAMKHLLNTQLLKKSLRAISVTAQAETMIGVDQQGHPVGEAIVWLDTRAQEEAFWLSKKIDGQSFYEKTGNPGIDPVMPLCKIPWIRKNQPDRYKKTAKFLLLRDYIVFQLCGILAGEHSTLSCSGFFDINLRTIDQHLLDIAGIPKEKLPPAMASTQVLGKLTRTTQIALGVEDKVYVVNGLLDQCASAIGAGNIKPGMITETTGTVLAIAATTEGFLATYEQIPVLCHALTNKYLVLPNCPTAGILLNWFADQFLADFHYDGNIFEHISQKVQERPAALEGVIALPHFSGRLSPVHAPQASGVLYGLTLGTNRYDIARAIMESIGFLLRENLDLLAKQGIVSNHVISLGGGAKSPPWMQIKADICGITMHTIKNDESTALGCALLAGMAIGKIPSVEDFSEYISYRNTYTPKEKTQQIYQQLYQQYLLLNTQLGFDQDARRKA